MQIFISFMIPCSPDPLLCFLPLETLLLTSCKVEMMKKSDYKEKRGEVTEIKEEEKDDMTRERNKGRKARKEREKRWWIS